MGEHEQEGAPAGATRSQHVVLQGAPDARLLAAAMRGPVERSRGGVGVAAPACLVVTPTVEQALTAADLARHQLGADPARVVPVTAVARAKRVLNAPVGVVTGTAEGLLALRRASALSLDAVRNVVLCGVDALLAAGAEEALVALLADCPGDTARTVTFEEETPEAAAFLQAQLRRPRRLAPPPAAATPLPLVPHVALTTAAGRGETLRMLLDELDPPSLVVVAPSAEGAQAATAALARLGVAVDGRGVQVVARPEAPHVTLLVFWEAPATAEALVEALETRPAQAVAFLLPDELPAFRRLTHGATLAWNPAPRKGAAEGRARQLRMTLEGTLSGSGGASASELALLAPLLETHDALEVAAAAVRLYESARREAAAARAALAALPPAPVVVAAAAAEGTAAGAPQGMDRAERPAPEARAFRPARPAAGRGGEREARPARPSFGRTGERSGERTGERPARPARPSFGRGGEREGRPARPSFGRTGERDSRPARPSFGRPGEREGRPARPSGFGGGAGGFGGGERGKGRPPRAGEERRAFGDRPPRERAEGRSEWQARGERLAHSKRPSPRRAPGRGADDEA